MRCFANCDNDFNCDAELMRGSKDGEGEVQCDPVILFGESLAEKSGMQLMCDQEMGWSFSLSHQLHGITVFK